MKLLFIVADITFVGGIERVIANLANSLSKESITTEILSLYKSNNNCNFEINKDIKISYLNENSKYDGKPGSIKRLFKHLRNISRLRSYLALNEYDVIVSNSFPTSFQLYFTHKSCSWITYEHVHFNYYNNNIKKLRTFIYKKFDKIVVLTKKDQEDFTKNFNTVVKIANPLSFTSEKTSELNNKTIIAVGRLEQQKGFDLLIDAYSKIANKHKDWVLKIYGEGSEKEKLINKISNLNIENIFLMGHSSNIRKEMLLSSILVVSSRFEGFSMVLAEAMECGLPSISFDCPNGPSDLIQHNHNGLLVNNGCIESLAINLDKLMQDESLRKNLSRNAKQYIKAISLPIVTKEWIKLIYQVRK
ncbi:MAG: glycosyltransferase family 4 protein [Providencia rettgeri]